MKIILLSIRTLLRFRLYTIVNIVGLALSLTCCILIFRYVHSEMMTDHFIEELDRVCFISIENETSHQPILIGLHPTAPYEANPLLDPAVEITSIYYENPTEQLIVNNKIYNAASVAADTNYLKIIQLPILKSNRTRLLERPGEAIISASLATLLFGKEDPMGKVIQISTGDQVTVTAIMGKPSTRFSMPVDILLSSSTSAFNQIRQPGNLVRLHPGITPEQANRNYTKFYKYYSDGTRARINFYPLKKRYFDNHIVTFQDNYLKGNYTHILILSAIALLILVIGLFNFINIYTVLVMKRAKEFGMKKMAGAGKQQIGGQLFAENLCMTTIALFLAWVMIEAGTNLFQVWMDIAVPDHIGFNLSLSIGILLLLPVITSLYPFFRYSYATPLSSIRSVGRSGSSTVSRNLFLCLQYILTILLTVTALFSIRQLNYMLNADPGFKTENIIMVPSLNTPSGNNMDMWKKFNLHTQQIANAIGESPLFTEYDFSAGPTDIPEYSSSVRLQGGEWKQTKAISSTGSYFKLLGLQAVEGRLWNDTTDSFNDFTVIINETAKKLLGIKDINKEPLEADRLFIFSTGMDPDRKAEYKIIGVVKDFNTGHLSKGIPPMVFYYYKQGPNNGIMARVIPGKKQEAIAFLKDKYAESFGGEFKYTFLEDQIRTLYDDDKRLVQVASFFAVIAILISSMGLFSLSLFDVQQRFHEIAIRKVNGAGTSLIRWLLLRKYLRLLLIAFLIASPLSWLLITRYLEDFAYKVAPAWWLYAVALLLTAGISLLTLIWQIQKAARTNPADTIRSE